MACCSLRRPFLLSGLEEISFYSFNKEIVSAFVNKNCKFLERRGIWLLKLESTGLVVLVGW
jgi:hypothetical protein